MSTANDITLHPLDKSYTVSEQAALWTFNFAEDDGSVGAI